MFEYNTIQGQRQTNDGLTERDKRTYRLTEREKDRQTYRETRTNEFSTKCQRVIKGNLIISGDIPFSHVITPSLN